MPGSPASPDTPGVPGARGAHGRQDALGHPAGHPAGRPGGELTWSQALVAAGRAAGGAGGAGSSGEEAGGLGVPRQQRLQRRPVPPGRNSLHYWREAKSLPRVAWNFVIISLCRVLPWFGLKNFLYRRLGMRVGRDVAFGLMAMVDVFWPELIQVGDNSIIGYNTVLLAHEFLIDEYRTGPVIIGRNVMIGANCTILPGVVIGDGAVVSAHSLVNTDVPPGAVVGGVPARPLRSRA
ncbi:acyltransferase [Thermaerobacter litoralis]